MGIKQQIEDTARDASSHLVSLQLSVEEKQLDIGLMQQQQIDMDSRVSDTVELVKQVSDEQKYFGGKIVETKREMSGMKQVMEDEARSTSTRLVSLESKQLTMEEKQSDIDVLQQQHVADIDCHVSHTVELMKQVSDEQKRFGEKITTLEETKRQISEEVEKTGELVNQLSVKDDEMQSHVNILRDDVDVMKSDMIKVKEEIDVIQHKGISCCIILGYRTLLIVGTDFRVWAAWGILGLAGTN